MTLEMARCNTNLDLCKNDVTLFMEPYTKGVIKKILQTNSERVKFPQTLSFDVLKPLYFNEIKFLRHFIKIQTIIALPRPQKKKHSQSQFSF